MKKYFFTVLVALIIGFFISIFFINQYDSYTGIKVSYVGDELYFIQYGVFSSIENMEEETISLQNYVYNQIDNMYYVYVGITNSGDNANKIINYFKNLGYETIIKKYQVNNKLFVEKLINYDEILSKTNDNTVISSLISQVLSEYEEVVISGKD